jgi:hypothetical protein
MNRRQFLSYLPLPFIPVSVMANGDDEIGIPVEPCPCCCTDDGISFYSCDEAGNPLPDDPAHCYDWDQEIEEALSKEPEYIYWRNGEIVGEGSGGRVTWFDSDEPLPVDGSTDNDVSQVVQLPATGSGSSLSPEQHQELMAWARQLVDDVLRDEA